MSANLLVFEKEKAPKQPIAFLKWFYTKAEWGAERDYNDIVGTSQKLIDFYFELKEVFPPMNGKYAPDDATIEADPGLEDRLTDYCIDDDLIYMAFAWSVADEAKDKVKELAFKHDLGYFDMFNVHLDEDTIMEIPQISREEIDEYSDEDKPKKGFFSRLFGGENG